MRRRFLWISLTFISITLVYPLVSFFRHKKEIGHKAPSAPEVIGRSGMNTDIIEKLRELQQKKEYDIVIKEATEYLNSGSDSADNLEVLIRLAECYQVKGQLDLAEKTIKKALGFAEDNAWALITSARVYLSKFLLERDEGLKDTNLTSAQNQIEKCLKSEPEQPHGNALAAEVYFYQKNKNKAKSAIRNALKADPQDEYFKSIAMMVDSEQ